MSTVNRMSCDQKKWYRYYSRYSYRYGWSRQARVWIYEQALLWRLWGDDVQTSKLTPFLGNKYRWMSYNKSQWPLSLIFDVEIRGSLCRKIYDIHSNSSAKSCSISEDCTPCDTRNYSRWHLEDSRELKWITRWGRSWKSYLERRSINKYINI